MFAEILAKPKLRELKMLKHFFEMCFEEDRPENQVAGTFGGPMPSFFGNVIQWNEFDIPIKAMRIIYEFNKERIDEGIESLTKEIN